MNSVIMRHAFLTARQTVRQDWRNQGRKLSWIAPRDITSFAIAYLEGDPQLIEEASEAVRNDPRLRTLDERREREMRNLGHRNLQSTARYTALAPDRFAKFWGD